jgi:hypothetical protein
MPETEESVRPLVDDRFWFESSKEMVQNATSSRNEAAAKLQTMIAWFWGIYTASASVGVALSKSTYSFPIILLIASPSVVLIAAYWVAVWVQMPIRAEFDPRIPSDIKRAYHKGIKIKNWKLNVAIALSFVAAAMVSVALIAASLSKQKSSLNFRAYYHTTKKGHNIIALSGPFPTDKIVLRITPFTPSGSLDINKEKELLLTSLSDQSQPNIEIDFVADKYTVTAEWEDEDGTLHSLTQIVIPKNNEKKQ